MNTLATGTLIVNTPPVPEAVPTNILIAVSVLFLIVLVILIAKSNPQPSSTQAQEEQSKAEEFRKKAEESASETESHVKNIIDMQNMYQESKKQSSILAESKRKEIMESEARLSALNSQSDVYENVDASRPVTSGSEAVAFLNGLVKKSGKSKKKTLIVFLFMVLTVPTNAVTLVTPSDTVRVATESVVLSVPEVESIRQTLNDLQTQLELYRKKVQTLTEISSQKSELIDLQEQNVSSTSAYIASLTIEYSQALTSAQDQIHFLNESLNHQTKATSVLNKENLQLKKNISSQRRRSRITNVLTFVAGFLIARGAYK